MAQDDVKRNASLASVRTLKSSVELSIDNDFDGLNASEKSNQPNRISSKDSRKGLLKSIFSTDSIGNTIGRLTKLGNSTSQNRVDRSTSNIRRSGSKNNFKVNSSLVI